MRSLAGSKCRSPASQASPCLALQRHSSEPAARTRPPAQARHDTLPALRGLEERLAQFEQLTDALQDSAKDLEKDIDHCRQAQKQQVGRATASLVSQHRRLYHTARRLDALELRHTALEQAHDARVCRFCLSSGGHLVAPCQCAGSQRWVHACCLVHWRRKGHDAVGRRKCEVCLAPYKLRVPRVAVGQLLVTAASDSEAAPFLGVALLIHFGDFAELVELGRALSSDRPGRLRAPVESSSFAQFTRMLGGPSGEDWALAALDQLPICEIPAGVQVNGELFSALCSPKAKARPCLVAGRATDVLGVCEMVVGDDKPRALVFEGRWRWPRRRLEQFLEQGVLGVVTASLEELWCERQPLARRLRERAAFHGGAWVGESPAA